MAKSKTPPVKPSLLKNPWIPGALLALVFIVILLYLTGVITPPHIGNSNVGPSNAQDDISTTPSNPSSSSGATDSTPVTPSIKIENATATLISVNAYDDYSHTCTIKMSGTVTGSECSFFTLSEGITNEEPDLFLYPLECPSWRYWGTSPLCSRESYAPTTTNWSITIEKTFYDFEGYRREYAAILDTSKQPVTKSPYGGELCTDTVKDKRFTDSVFLTC
jgi:hypothetical protein